ncbi:Cof-type HAD-IIB family hydrolase [Streptococcus sp. zg-JUN1979]|uniref:Cof-type HAD-IIB family hydrolase n=1 Tax=Streptococcus sp. zg-JUN1979 TaxID=3391450 RepID=UPI0039A6D339
MTVKLIAIDLDGTLLDSHKELPKANIEAIKKAVAAGIKVVLCTGRPKSGVLPYFEQLGLTGQEYIIMNNGCSIYQTSDWSLLHYERLLEDDISYLVQLLNEYPQISLTLTGDKSYYVLADSVPELVAYDASLVFDEARAVDMAQLKAEQEVIFQAMYMGEAKTLDAFQDHMAKELKRSFSVVRSQEYIYEALPKGATKASALAILARDLQIEASEIMAIGDALNDLEMLTFAGVGVAMENASEEIKKASNFVTKTNDQAGVAYAICHYALGGRDEV